MKYNTDGFNERTNYIHNAIDANKPTHEFDNSFAAMRANEHKPDIETVNNEKIIVEEEVKGNKDNFVIRNNNVQQSNVKPNGTDPVYKSLQSNKTMPGNFNSINRPRF